MGDWLAQHGLQLLQMAGLLGLYLIRVGEWKARREDQRVPVDTAAVVTSATAAGVTTALDLLREQLRGEISTAAHKAKHDAIDAASVKLGELVTRFDRAGRQTSDLASRVQALPTRNDIAALWTELNRVRDGQDEIRRDLTSVLQQVARLGVRAKEE